MSDFQTVSGFEEVWRPPVRPRRRTPETLLGTLPSRTGAEVRARLGRLVNGAPEVMVKVTGRTRDPGGLRAHLDYISRNGALEMEDRDGAVIAGRGTVNELAEDWSDLAIADRRRRAATPFSRSVMLSMPEGTDPLAVRDAARAFAQEVFADRFDYVFALHTDTARPHVHIAVRALGDHGERLNPKKADLEIWRQVFAQALRDRGVEAEATPRRARGVTRKAERGSLRRMRGRQEAGKGEMATVRRAAYQEPASAAFRGQLAPTPWEARTLDRQAHIRALYLAQAEMLRGSVEPADRMLGVNVETFLRSMPGPDSQRLAFAQELRAAHEKLRRDQRENGRCAEVAEAPLVSSGGLRMLLRRGMIR